MCVLFRTKSLEGKNSQNHTTQFLATSFLCFKHDFSFFKTKAVYTVVVWHKAVSISPVPWYP